MHDQESLDYQGKTLWIASTGSSADTFLDAHNQLVAQVRALQAKDLPPPVKTK